MRLSALIMSAALFNRSKSAGPGDVVSLTSTAHSEDPKSRIVKGFHELVLRTYPNLRMLRGVNYNEGDIRRHLDFNKTAMVDTELTEEQLNVLAFIQSNKKIGQRTTMKRLEGITGIDSSAASLTSTTTTLLFRRR